MLFKSDRIRAEWADPRLSLLLHDIATAAAGRASARWDWDFFITCIWRSPQENDALYGGKGDHLDGVHVEWRGIDIRTFGIDPAAVLDVTTFVNDTWDYDPSRPEMRVALPEGGGVAGSSAQHLHLQTHPNTTPKTGMA